MRQPISGQVLNQEAGPDIYTNHPEKLSCPIVVTNECSDHKMVICIRYTKKSITKPRIVSKMSHKNFGPCMF